MKVNRKELLDGLGELLPGLSDSNVIEQSNCFVFSGNGEVYAYNDEFLVSWQGGNMCAFEGAVAAKPLLQLLEKSKQEEVDIDVESGTLVVKGKSFEAGLPVEAQISFPIDAILSDEDDSLEWVELPEDFLEGLEMVRHSAGRDMTYPALTCIHFDKNVAESCDSKQASHYVFEESLGDVNFFLPEKHVGAIKIISPDEYALGHSFIQFFNSKKMTYLACRMFDVEYPNIAYIFDVKGQEIKFPKQSGDIVDRASIFAQEEFTKDAMVSVKITENLMTIEGKNDYGWYKEKCRLRYKGDELSFNINPKLLKNILERDTNLIVGDKSISIEADKFHYVVALTGKKE